MNNYAPTRFDNAVEWVIENAIMKIIAVFILIIPALFILIIPALIACGVISDRVQSRCLRAGYSGGGMTIDFDTYCTRRVNGTDVVVPLRVAEGR